MEAELKTELMRIGTDVEGALRRFCGNEKLYRACLQEFLEDRTLVSLEQAIGRQAWGDAHDLAHTLKGTAGNMGFVPLSRASAELVEILRAGKMTEIDVAFAGMKACCREIASTLARCCTTKSEGKEL